MSSGSATRTQSVLDFRKAVQKNPPETRRDSQQQPSQQQKRPRNDLEVPLVHVTTDETDGSGSSNSLFDSASTTTIVEPETQDNTEERTKCIRLDRLRNKEERYESHITFLKDCLAIKRIPKGLVINLEPTIGNHDEEFLAKWYQRLEEFSMIMMTDIVEYSERVKTETTQKISTEQETLRAMMKPDDFREVTQIMDQNSSERKRALQVTKRKKFNYLKYHRETPMQQRTTHRNATNSNTSPGDYPQRNEDNSRWRNNHNNRNSWNQNNQTARNEPRTERNWNTRHHTDQERALSPNNYLRRTNSRNNLSRKNSWSNMNDRNRDAQKNQQTENRENEIRRLRERIATMEMERNEPTTSKNGPTPVGEQKTGQPNAEQVLNFITTTMTTLEEFKKHFATLQLTSKTQ